MCETFGDLHLSAAAPTSFNSSMNKNKGLCSSLCAALTNIKRG